MLSKETKQAIIDFALCAGPVKEVIESFTKEESDFYRKVIEAL